MSETDSTPVESRSGRDGEKVLDDGEDLAYQHREWTAQRIGWVVMGLLVVAALLGLLGSMGPLSTAHSATPDESLGVSYLRFERHHAPARLVVQVAPEAVEAGEVRLWLDEDYLGTLGLQSIVPEPESMELGAERVTYVFAVGEGSGPMEIVFMYQHDGFWQQDARLGLVNGPSVEFDQFIFP